MSIEWDVYKSPTEHCASYKTRQKYWNIDPDEKKACIPRLIWSDGHTEWSRWYWFKDKYEHMIGGYYIGFKR